MIYNSVTSYGDCGTPIVITRGRLAGKVLGIHVAGNMNPNTPQGAASIILREWLEESMKPPRIPIDRVFVERQMEMRNTR